MKRKITVSLQKMRTKQSSISKLKFAIVVVNCVVVVVIYAVLATECREKLYYIREKSSEFLGILNVIYSKEEPENRGEKTLGYTSSSCAFFPVKSVFLYEQKAP